MNKIIITEQQLNFIRESVEIENIKLPDFILDSVKQHKTSLGKHNSFPPEKDIKFEIKILKKRYFELLKSVKRVDGINGDISKKNLIKRLEQLVVKCKKIEEPIKNELERICYEFVFDMFGIKYGELNVECELNDSVEVKQQITPVLLDDSFFNDISHIQNFNDEVMKRRLINSLIQGACVRLSSNYEKILNKIYVLDQRLPEIYFNIMSINEYLSFVKERKPNNDNIGGIVSVNLSGEEPIIKSKAIIFPTLVFETIRGIMELISSHGLPEDKKEAEYIISQADFALAENWDKRFGVGMWDILMDTINQSNAHLLSEIFSELVSIETNEFDDIMREIFAGTKKGKRIINDLVSNISIENKFNEIDNKLKSGSDDSYFTPEELIGNVDEIVETSTFSAGDYTYDAPAFLDKETADHSNMIAKSMQESKDYYDFFDINYIYNILSEFESDKENGRTVKKWDLIPFEQYKNALIEFVRYGKFMRFPTKYIDRWCKIITQNTLSIQAITELAGHTSYLNIDDVNDFFYGDENGNYFSNYHECYEYLDNLGFYDWCQLPDGSDAWSDYGLEPLYKLIMTLEEADTPEQKIVVINKILDVYHQRGDLASAFIEGGSKSLSDISGI